MKLTLRKDEIKREIDKIEDEKLLWAIARLLHLDDEGEVPEWHKSTVQEREKKYETRKGKMKDWDDVKDRL